MDKGSHNDLLRELRSAAYPPESVSFCQSETLLVRRIDWPLQDDTLVVDTIGLNDKTFLDNYRTPHTDKLHVTERWRLIEDGKKLEILMTIDDPDTFMQPWQALRQYDRVNRTLSEDICSENNFNPFGIDYDTPAAEKPDF